MAIDWKIEPLKPDNAEKVRQRDESTFNRAGEDRPRPQLNDALKQLTKPIDSSGENIKPKTPEGRSEVQTRSESRESLTSGRAEQAQKGQANVSAQTATRSIPADPKKVVSHGATPAHSQNVDVKNRSANLTTAQAASNFAIKPQESPLANLLTGRTLPPASPRATEAEGKKNLAPNSPQEILQTKQDLKGVAALPQAAQGSRTPDASIKREDRGTTEKRSDEKRSSKSERSGGKGSLSHKEAGAADGETALQATSSGVTSGGGEPVWIADQDPGIQVYNGGVKDSSVTVLRSYHLYQRFVAKNPGRGEEVLHIFEKAIHLDGELEQILKEGLAARLNVYGGTSA